MMPILHRNMSSEAQAPLTSKADCLTCTRPALHQVSSRRTYVLLAPWPSACQRAFFCLNFGQKKARGIKPQAFQEMTALVFLIFFLGLFTRWRFGQCLDAQADATLPIDLQHFDLHFLTFSQYGGDIFYPIV